jgi:4,5:9,10-diseco-3-hydroxy-5,9,17-trioxoandrosta-1(10),2-diene-4-oate hydrolase
VLTATLLPDERAARAGDVTIRYAEAGAGPPLVLLHGDGESWRSWSAVMPALARTHRVVAPSLPGYGGSSRPDGPLTPHAIASRTGGFLTRMGIERPVLVGNSLGALTAVLMALEDPGATRALVLIASAGLGREVNPLLALSAAPGHGELAIAAARTPAGALQRALARQLLLFGDPHRAPLSWLAEQTLVPWLPDALEASLSARRAILGPLGQRTLVLDRLGALDVPVLVLWGERDLVFPPAHGRAAVARLPRGRLELIAGCGHLAPLDRPDETLAAVRRFLTTLA